MMNEVIEQAKQLGQAAFARGAQSVPALDKEFCELLYANAKKPGDALPILTAWTEAWHAANLAAPVERDMQELFGEPISTYTRAQAIEDGVLVCANTGDFDEVTRQHFKYPVAMTAALFALIEKAVKNPNWNNDFKGVWHDVCHMSKHCAHSANETTRIFRCFIKGAGRRSLFELKAVCGPGDKGEPVMTFMLANED